MNNSVVTSVTEFVSVTSAAAAASRLPASRMSFAFASPDGVPDLRSPPEAASAVSNDESMSATSDGPDGASASAKAASRSKVEGGDAGCDGGVSAAGPATLRWGAGASLAQPSREGSASASHDSSLRDGHVTPHSPAGSSSCRPSWAAATENSGRDVDGGDSSLTRQTSVIEVEGLDDLELLVVATDEEDATSASAAAGDSPVFHLPDATTSGASASEGHAGHQATAGPSVASGPSKNRPPACLLADSLVQFGG